MKYIVNLKNITPDDLELAGSKAVGLAGLSGSFNVATGYVLTTAAFDRFIEENNLKEKVRHLLAISSQDNDLEFEKISNEVQQLVAQGSIPPDIAESIKEAYFGLNIKNNVAISEMTAESEPMIVVRSSPVEELSEKMNKLQVMGTNELLKSVVACYSSLFTPKAIKEQKTSIAMPVLIQKMIMPRISGSISQDGTDISVRASYGLSDETYDHYVVTPELEIKTVSIGKQDTALMQGNNESLEQINLTAMQSENQKLNDKQITVLAKLWQKSGITDKQIEYIIDNETYYFTQVKDMEKKELESEQSKTDIEEAKIEQRVTPEAAEPAQKEDAQADEQGGNTIFNLFKAGREEIPDIPTEPKPEPAEPVEEPPETVIEDPVETVQPAEPMTTIVQADEPTIDEPEEIPAEPVMSAVAETAEEITPEPKSSEIHPLTKEEWLSTLNLEHTKMVISYDLIIQKLLEERFVKMFDREPEDFEDMIESLEARNAVSHEDDIRKIRAIRNDFLNDHSMISIDDLKDAYETTLKIINDL